MLKALAGVLVAPKAGFAAIREAPPIVLPMGILVAATILVYGLYIGTVDLEFMVEDAIANMGDVTVEQEEMTRQGLIATGPITPVFGAIAAGAGVGMMLVLALFGLYLWIVGKTTGDGGPYRASLSLASWAFLPTLISSLIAVVVVLVADEGRVSQTDLSPLNLVWLFGLDAGSLTPVIRSFDLTYLWTIALVAIGYREWYEVSGGRAAAIAVAPFVAVYGVWLVWAAM